MDNYTTITTIRHAETSYNRDKRYAGTIDVPLTKAGMQDALEASKKMQGMDFDVVITSTLKRAIETSRILVDENIPLVQNQLCNERDYGKMQGLTADEVKSIKLKIMYINVGGIDHSVNPHGGEPFESLRTRAEKFHRFVFKNYRGSNILIVSHGVFLQQFHGLIRGKSCIESLGIEVPNLELTAFRFRRSRLISESSMRLSDREHISW